MKPLDSIQVERAKLLVKARHPLRNTPLSKTLPYLSPFAKCFDFLTAKPSDLMEDRLSKTTTFMEKESKSQDKKMTATAKEALKRTQDGVDLNASTKSLKEPLLADSNNDEAQATDRTQGSETNFFSIFKKKI